MFMFVVLYSKYMARIANAMTRQLNYFWRRGDPPGNATEVICKGYVSTFLDNVGTFDSILPNRSPFRRD
jgi:hypothetical protein